MCDLEMSRNRVCKQFSRNLVLARCRSRLTREEHICRQVCKDKVPAPSDLVRAEVEMLRSLEHPAIPQVIASFEDWRVGTFWNCLGFGIILCWKMLEGIGTCRSLQIQDFNNIYIVLEPVESIELVNVLQQWHQTGQGLSVGWLAEIARQLLEAFRHCHELRPHSLVHGDLRLTSLLLSAMTDAKCAPQLVLSDLGLAGLPPAPPLKVSQADAANQASEDWSQCPCPLLDVWSCGCLIFMLLSGRHPFNGDPGGRLVPSALLSITTSPPEPDWRLLPSASSASLCAQMLSWDLKSRPAAADCLRHSWLSADDSHDVPLPMEALGNLLQLGFENSWAVNQVWGSVLASCCFGVAVLFISLHPNVFAAQEISPQVEAARDHSRPCHLWANLLAFLCHWCSFGPARSLQLLWLGGVV